MIRHGQRLRRIATEPGHRWRRSSSACPARKSRCTGYRVTKRDNWCPRYILITARILQDNPRLADGLQPLLAIFGEASADQCLNGWWYVLGQRGPIRLDLHDRSERVCHGISAESALTAQHLVEHRTEGPDIRSPIHVRSRRLFRSHVRSGSQDYAYLRVAERERRRS